jgi:phage terminase large subunit-like protein
VADLVERINNLGLLPEKGAVGVDPVGIAQIVYELNARGLGELVVAVNQGWRLNGAIKTMERDLSLKELMHGGQAMMAWCVGNAKVKAAGNAITIDKQNSGTAKIDPLVATFNAVSLMSLNPEPAVTSDGLIF